MPAKTPQTEPPPGAKFVADAVADNVRAYRVLGRLEQEDIAERMRQLGHPWKRVTVSEVERGRRNVTVPELVALTLVLGVTATELLDPRRPDQRSGDGEILLVLTPDGAGQPISPRSLTGLMCRHELEFDAAEFWGRQAERVRES
jgi:transcriptional regulator with XRE-family HTH domain